MDIFPLQYVAPLVDVETDSTRMVPSVIMEGHGRITRIRVEDSPLDTVLKKNHVEVEVQYCGMNFTDNYLRLGIIRNYRFPVIMGSECCGVVTRVGNNIADIKPGSKVLCLKMMGGLFRRLVHVPRNNVFPLPDDISLQDAIGLGINYLVAHVCLFELGGLKADDVVFMQSIAGGVGTALTQLAKTMQNVEVLGTASESKFEDLKAHGVRRVYRHHDDYVQQVLKAHPDGVDIIVNSSGGADIEKCFKMLKRCGTLILIGSNSTAIYPKTTTWGLIRPTWDAQTVSSAELISKNYTVAGVNIGLLLVTHPEMMQAMVAKIFKLRSEGKLEPRIHSILPFEKITDGITELCERKNYGKIILDVTQKATTSDESHQPLEATEAQPLLQSEEATGMSKDPTGMSAEAAKGRKQESKQEGSGKPDPPMQERQTTGTSGTNTEIDAQPMQPEEKTFTEVQKDAREPQ